MATVAASWRTDCTRRPAPSFFRQQQQQSARHEAVWDGIGFSAAAFAWIFGIFRGQRSLQSQAREEAMSVIEAVGMRRDDVSCEMFFVRLGTPILT